ncbi:hypothetical protein N657DRAFT_249636 [Parathielavia appendiculata]|uniref:Uncharacterized protein n=1 Tax=Parathielavia appendiculata TaxID=2587402 RepID=A0AAN6TRV1_9PEZI|nr:hypothetical protein N657DRAFT_249636 [Parathielavia appendiculata]
MERQAATPQGDAQQLATMMAQVMAQMRDQNQQMMAQLRDQIDNLRTEQANEREAMGLQIKALQNHIAAMQNTSVDTPPAATPTPQPSASAPPAPASTQTKKKPTLPDPPRFDGVRRNAPIPKHMSRGQPQSSLRLKIWWIQSRTHLTRRMVRKRS